MNEQMPVPDSIHNNYQVWQGHDGLLTAESRANHVYNEHPHPADAGYVLESEPAGDEKQRGIAYTETELAGKPFVIAERPGSRKEELEAEAAAAEPEPQGAGGQGPEPAPASPEPGSSQQPEQDPKGGIPIIFSKMAAGVRRVAEQYSLEGTELTSEDLSEDVPMLIRTKADANGTIGIYFAPKGLVDGAVIDITKTIDQGRLVYLTPPESHVEDGKLVGDGPGYSSDEPYPSMTIGQPWNVGSVFTQPIESVQVSKGFLHEVPSHKIPQEQRGGPETFDPLIRLVNDHRRAEAARASRPAGIPERPTQLMIDLGLNFPEPEPDQNQPAEPEPEPELTRRQRIREGLGDMAHGAGYVGRLALIEAAYHAGNLADRIGAAKDRISGTTRRMAEHSKIFRGKSAESLANLAYTVDYLGSIALIETAYHAGNAKDGAAYHAGNVADNIAAFFRNRLQRRNKNESVADAEEESPEEPSDEHNVEIVSRQHNWDWSPDPGFEWEDNWGR